MVLPSTTARETGSLEFRPDAVEDISRLSIKTAAHGENSSWEAVERMKDECDANEKLVEEALAERRYLKAADYHLTTIKLKEKLSPQFPFLKMAKIEAYIKQLRILLQCSEPPGLLQQLLPSNWENLLRSECEPLEREDYGKFYALLGSLYMRSYDNHGWSYAIEHLDRALRYLVEVSPQPVSFITKTAQNLVDILDLLGERATVEGRLQWLKRRTLPELTTEIKVGRISATKLWCQEQGFSVQRFDEMDNSRNCSPLAFAVKETRYNEVEAMLSFTSETSPPSDLASELLLLAADTRSSEVARLLIARGANVTIQDDTGKTVLHRCQHCPKLGNQGGLKIANLFLDAYGDLLDKQDNSGKTALYMACESGHIDMLDLLLKRGAKPNIVEASGKTALYRACERGQLDIVRRLLKQRAEPNSEGPGKLTPLMVAVMMASKKAEKDRLDVVKELIKFRADPKKVDHKGHDAFHQVAGPLASELKHALKEYLKADSSSARKSTRAPSTEVSVSESGNKARHWLLFNSSSSDNRSRSSKSRISGSNATSSSKSIFSDATSTTNVTIPSSDTNLDQITAGSLFGGVSKRPDHRGAQSNLPAISETLPPRQPDVIGSALGNRDVELVSQTTLPVNNATNPRSRPLTADFDKAPRYPDSPRSRGRLSSLDGLRESLSVTDTSSVLSCSEAGSEVVSERRHSSRQNLPRTLHDLFPIAASQSNRQHPAASGAHGYGSNAQGWASNSSSGNSGRGAAGSSSRPPSNYNHTPGESDRNNDTPDNTGVAGERDSQDSSPSFACPFAKAYTARYFPCNFKTLLRIKDMKQHLERKHRQPAYCPHCKMQFPTSRERDEHIMAWSCQISNQPEPDGITSDQFDALKRRVSSKLSHDDQWYKIFDIVFPNWDPRPTSPYVQRDFGLSEFSDRHSRPIAREYTRQSSYQGDAELLENLIVIGVRQVIQAFLEGSPPSPMGATRGSTSESGPVFELQSPAQQDIGEDNTITGNHDHFNFGPAIPTRPQQTEDITQWHNNPQGSQEHISDRQGPIPPGVYPDPPMLQSPIWPGQASYIPPAGDPLPVNWGNNTDVLVNHHNTPSATGPMNFMPEHWYCNQPPPASRDPSGPDWG